MLRYGAGGGLPVKDEFDLKTVERLRIQKANCDNLPSVEEEPNRTVVQNRLLGMATIKMSCLFWLLFCTDLFLLLFC